MIMRPMPDFWKSARMEPYWHSGLLELMRTHQLDGVGYSTWCARSRHRSLRRRTPSSNRSPAQAAATGPAFGDRAEQRTTGPVPARAEAEEAPRTVAISYVGADQPWAEYLGNLLRTNNYDVELVRWNAGRRERLYDSVARARGSGDGSSPSCPRTSSPRTWKPWFARTTSDGRRR